MTTQNPYNPPIAPNRRGARPPRPGRRDPMADARENVTQQYMGGRMQQPVDRKPPSPRPVRPPQSTPSPGGQVPFRRPPMTASPLPAPYNPPVQQGGSNNMTESSLPRPWSPIESMPPSNGSMDVDPRYSLPLPAPYNPGNGGINPGGMYDQPRPGVGGPMEYGPGNMIAMPMNGRAPGFRGGGVTPVGPIGPFAPSSSQPTPFNPLRPSSGQPTPYNPAQPPMVASNWQRQIPAGGFRYDPANPPTWGPGGGNAGGTFRNR